MTMAGRFAQSRFVAVEKISGCAYLHAVFAAWHDGDVIVPIDAGSEVPVIGLPPGELIVPSSGGGWFEETIALDMSDAPAQISMTSGTTGKPKAILLSRRALSDVTRRLIEAQALDDSIREYLGVPVTYSFGLGRARVIAAVGGKAYLPEHGFRAEELAAMLRAGDVNALSAVPTLLRLLLAQRALFADCAGALRWLEIGSQYMSGSEKAEIRALFPNARIIQHYGLTEASRTTFLRIDGAPEHTLESVGAATGDAHIKIDSEGLICVSGPHVADGRIVEGDLIPIIDADGWLHTSDKGAIEDGLLYYHGRADDVLNVSGVKVSTEYFEQRLIERAGADAQKIAVAGRLDPLRGQSVMVVHLPDVALEPLRVAAHAVAADMGLGAADVTLVCVDEIPRTQTGKVQRRLLTERHGSAAAVMDVAVSAPAGGVVDDNGLSPSEASVAAMWREALGVTSIARDDSFFDIGGDSLSAITVALRAEQHGMPKEMMHLMFEGRTVAEIAALMDGASAATMKRSRIAMLGDMINITRGILVLVVIAAHWVPFLVVRLGPQRETVERYIDLLFHMGTPGFAMVFGIGVSFFYMPMFERSAERLASKVRSNTLLLGGGVLLIALVEATRRSLVHDWTVAIWPEQTFYNVILAYFLLLPTVPLLIRAVRLTPHVVLNSLILSATGIALLMVCHAVLDGLALTGFANLGRLMATSAYSYPQMLAAVGIGMAIGQWLRVDANAPDLPRRCVQLGLLAIVTGSEFVIYTGGFWAHPRQPQAFILYAGVILLLIPLVLKLVEAQAGTWLLRPLLLLGLLSFPAFIGHGIVIPLKDIGVALGLRYAVALALALAAFLLLGGYAMLRLNRIYFGGGSKAPAVTDPAVEAF